MAWTYQLVQQKDDNGDNIPIWIVIQWNTESPNTKYETAITAAVKEAAYPND